MKTKLGKPARPARSAARKTLRRKYQLKKTAGASPLDRLSDLVANEVGPTGTRQHNRSATSTAP
jgi:hypothetical protein